MIDKNKKLAAAWRRFAFESIKALGVFWIIEKVPFLQLKQPWKKMYQRSKKQ